MIPTAYVPKILAEPADAEDRYQGYLAHTVEYNAAIVAAGDQPWHDGDEHRRRECWFRRYRRPDPPEGLNIPDIRNCNREKTAEWLASGWTWPGNDPDRRPDRFFEAEPKPDWLSEAAS